MTVLGLLLKTILGNAASGGLYPGRAEGKPATPYAVYQHFGPINNSLSGPSNLQNQIVQIDVYSTTYIEAASIKQLFESLMSAQSAYGSPTAFSSMQTGSTYLGVEAETKLHRFMLQFSVWFY